MHITPTSLADLLLIEPAIFSDERGFFVEIYQRTRFASAGISQEFIQDNLSGSRRGVLRGLHFQVYHPQGKLIRAVVGEIFDVCVDLRRSSPTFGRWSGFRLSGENKYQLWIPAGFAHGFYTLSEWAEIQYKVDNIYDPSGERTLLWNDAQVGVDWPLIDGQSPILSEKDAQGRRLSELELFE